MKKQNIMQDNKTHTDMIDDLSRALDCLETYSRFDSIFRVHFMEITNAILDKMMIINEERRKMED